VTYANAPDARTPNVGPSIDSRSRPTRSAETCVSAPPARLLVSIIRAEQSADHTISAGQHDAPQRPIKQGVAMWQSGLSEEFTIHSPLDKVNVVRQ
jgi:hypothetical protein